MLRRAVFTLSWMAGLALTGSAWSQDTFPNKPVRIVVPQTPGGASDALARIMAQKLSEKWGQSVVVENRAGAGGNVGMEVVAQAAPDGHTLLMSYAGSHAINPALYKKLPFDPVKDFAPVATLATLPFVLVARPDATFKSVSELMEQGRKSNLTFGSAGNGSVNHLLGVMFNMNTGTQMTHAPYKGRQFAIPDLIGGSIQLMFDNMPSALPMAKEGKIRALAVTTAKRSAAAPDIPTVGESLPGFEATTWFALFAPAGTPKAVIERLNAETVRIFKLPDIQERLAKLGLEPVLSSPEELARYQASEIVKWTKVVKDSGASAD